MVASCVGAFGARAASELLLKRLPVASARCGWRLGQCSATGRHDVRCWMLTEHKLASTFGVSSLARFAGCRRCYGAYAANAAAGLERLDGLRTRLRELGVDWFLVPSEDPHLSEYVPSCFERRAFVSGFTGSYGVALVPAAAEDEPRLWTDGRYFVQAEKELFQGWELMRIGEVGVPTTDDWLVQHLRSGDVLGMDPQVHSAEYAQKLRSRLAKKGVTVRCLGGNPVDDVWGSDRPLLCAVQARLHPDTLAGRSAADKLEAVRAAMTAEGAEALVVSALDEVAYLLNLRGGDVPHVPVLLAYVLVEHDSATLFADQAKLPAELVAALSSVGVAVHPYVEAIAAVEAVASSKKLWLDVSRTNLALCDAASVMGGKGIVTKASPLLKMKAVKNEAELAGMRAAHRRDGAALVSALVALELSVSSGEYVTEVDVDARVTAARAAQDGYLDNSFDTIAGYAANGAIIHYRAVSATAATLGTSALFLLDSGAQYADGTTDVTRTMHFGEPTAHEQECFTRVLQGHIALATAVFPEGTPGFVLDAFARRPLWAAGLDYRHGTGHGVGAALAVHEGPHRISRQFDNLVSLEPGMVVSDEPGYYVDGQFGIRIENLLVVVEADTPNNFGGKQFLTFKPLTLVPIQRKLIRRELLSSAEVKYVDDYHARVRSEISPLLPDASVRAWLDAATEPLACA